MSSRAKIPLNLSLSKDHLIKLCNNEILHSLQNDILKCPYIIDNKKE